MKRVLNRNLIATMFIALLAFTFAGNGRAELADLSDVPLANSPSDAVLPNLMYILDDSGSMMWDYMPDNVQRLTNQTVINNCKSCGSSTCSIASTQCALGNGPFGSQSVDGNTADWADPPYFASKFNQIYYNPDITYAPAVNSLGISLGNMSPTAAQKDAYLDTTTRDLTAVYPETYYCNSSVAQMSSAKISGTVLTVSTMGSGTLAVGSIISDTGGNILPGTIITSNGTGSGGTGTYNINFTQTVSSEAMMAATPTQLTNTTICRRNGINNIQAAPNNYFLYWSNNTTAGTPLGAYPVQTGTASSSFRFPFIGYTGHPYYFTIAAHEYCSDSNLINCALANADGSAPSGYSIPAPIRYCGTTTNAASTSAVSDAATSTSPKCRKKFDVNNYLYPRYGRFTRTDIVPATATYTKSATSVRTDCASTTSCTYAEEVQNFANWNSYYRTRMAMMKTATGRAFLPIDDRYRVGFITINPGAGGSNNGVVDATHPVLSSKYLPLATFDSTQKGSFYTTLYAQSNNGSTPLRRALSRVGRHYAGITTGINNGMSTDPVSYSCQQNFALLTTDGYWNDNDTDAIKPNNAQVGNQDNTPDTAAPFYVSRATVTLDGMGTQYTNVQPTTILEQTLCSANTSTAFSAGTQTTCGCAAGQRRIKQRTIVQTTTTTGTDGIQSGTSTTAAPATFQDITACDSNVSTAVTPTTIVEQAKVVANAATTFGTVNGVSTGANTTGSCAAGQDGIRQRTTTYNTTVLTTDGVVGAGTTSGTTYTFASVGSCVAQLVSTSRVVTTITEQQVLVANATSTFAVINGVSAGANQAATCAANNASVMTRKTVYNTDTVTTDGGSPTTSANSTTYTITPGACTALTKTVTTAITETQSVIANSGATTSFTNLNSGTGNPQTTAPTCSPASKKSLIKRTMTYNQIVTTVGTGAPTTSYSAASAAFSVTTNCTSSSLTAVAAATSSGSSGTVTTGAPTAALPTTVNAGPTVTTTGGPIPVPAAPTNTVGATVTTNNGGNTITAANITINPNPNTTVGTVTTTNVPGGTANTLADVAMYYYKTDLRTTGTVAPNNVPTTDKDIAPHQHMVTFTLGMGLQGQMDYLSSYESSTTGDFAKIKNGATTCEWITGTCNWPAPASATPTTLDDLWHAAVNGRGIYYSASDPNTLADGLSGALSALKVQTAAASASATSSPNITETDNFIYSSTFRTVKWDGEIVAQRIDTSSGNVLPTIAWSAQTLLDGRVTATTDSRTIWTFSSSTSTKLKPFLWANLNASQQAFFANKCTALSQCSLLTATQQTAANDGQNMVNFLRGQTQNEATLYRDRDHVLGDPVNATPTFVKAPRFNFNDSVTPSYGTFKAANTSRQGVLYIAANDGMLHAFNGDTGDEMWAYVPRMVMPELYNLATDNWDVKHQFIVDGSPQVMDVYDSSASAWKTILVAGLNKGGRGYYALDITDPINPKGLWEICSDSTLCSVSDGDIGMTYGYPVITKRAFDGKWVALVTSGMNNLSPGSGHGFMYVLDALTGAILRKVDTGAGDTTTPSGFAKISAFANAFNVDNTATFVYGGDLLGNVWRMDMSVDPPAVFKLAILTDASNRPQSITARPELAVISGSRVVYIGTGRYLGENDLPDASTLSPALPWAYQQSLYAIKDRSVALGNIRLSSPGLVQQTITDNGTSRTTSTNAVDWINKDGWFVDFNPASKSPGERVNLDPQLDLGTLVVATNVPNNSACTVGGDSWLYQFDYKAGTYVASASGQQVAQKFTGQTLVGIVVVRLPSGVLKAIATGATGVKTPVGVNIGGGGASGRRVSWRELIQ